MRNILTILIAIFVCTSIAFAQSVEIKDSAGDALITVNEEGSDTDDGGSITLPDAGTVGTTTDKLYNVSGNLYWDGNALSTSSPLWTASGSDIYFDTGDVGIGLTNPSSNLTVRGDDMLSTNHAFSVLDGSDNPALRVFNNRKIGINFASGPVAMLGIKGEDQTVGNMAFKAMDVMANSLLEIRNNGNVGIGPGGTTPLSKLHIFENSAYGISQLLIDQQGAGDAFQVFTNSSGTDYSVGIDAVDQNFKITNRSDLTNGYGSSQSDAFTLLQARSSGIIDFNKQSRTRAWLGHSQTILYSTWTGIEFEFITYDEHVEFAAGSMGAPGKFTATTDGYYQINSRTGFDYWTEEQVHPGGYVSIAIFVNSNIYAQGNDLILVNLASQILGHIIAPNVSDVVFLNAGDVVEIHAYQNVTNLGIPIIGGGAKTYVSIHKVS